MEQNPGVEIQMSALGGDPRVKVVAAQTRRPECRSQNSCRSPDVGVHICAPRPVWSLGEGG